MAFLFNASWLAEKEPIPILILWYLIWLDLRIEPTIYRTRGEHANHYTTDVVLHMFE